MFLSEWREFPSMPCLAGKKTWWQLASRCCRNRARPQQASELVSFLVGLRTYQHPCMYCLSIYIRNNVLSLYETTRKLHEFINFCRSSFCLFWGVSFMFTDPCVLICTWAERSPQINTNTTANKEWTHQPQQRQRQKKQAYNITPENWDHTRYAQRTKDHYLIRTKDNNLIKYPRWAKLTN